MDADGTIWRIQPSDGSFVRQDGSPGEPAAKSPPVARASPPAGEGLATVRLLKALALGMKKGFVRSIPLMVVSMAAIGGIHTLLVLFVKKGAQTGNPHPLVASILILPGHEAAGMLFWGLLIGLSISFITKVRHGQLSGTLQKVVTTPGFIRQSFDRTGFLGLLLFLLGSAIALLFAGIIANVLVSLQCILFCANTLVAQRESLLAFFLQAMGSDIARGLHVPAGPAEYPTWFSTAGITGVAGGFLVSLVVSSGQFIVPILLAICVFSGLFMAMLYSAKKGRNAAAGGLRRWGSGREVPGWHSPSLSSVHFTFRPLAHQVEMTFQNGSSQRRIFKDSCRDGTYIRMRGMETLWAISWKGCTPGHPHISSRMIPCFQIAR